MLARSEMRRPTRSEPVVRVSLRLVVVFSQQQRPRYLPEDEVTKLRAAGRCFQMLSEGTSLQRRELSRARQVSSAQADDGGVKSLGLAAVEVKQSRPMSQPPLVSSPLSLSSIITSSDCGQDDCHSESGAEEDEAAAEDREWQAVGKRRAGSSPVREGIAGRQRTWAERRKQERTRRQQGPLAQAEVSMVKTAAESLQAISHDSSALLVFGGWLGGERCHSVLVDAGASSNFVSSSWVRRHKLKIEQLSRPLEVVLADGRTMGSLTGAVQVDDALVNGSSAPCRLVVMDQLSHDVILGLPWLRAAGVVLGCGPDHHVERQATASAAAGARHRRSRIGS